MNSFLCQQHLNEPEGDDRMSNYRVEAWIQPFYGDEWDEDKIEVAVHETLNSLGLTVQGGPVVLKMYGTFDRFPDG